MLKLRYGRKGKGINKLLERWSSYKFQVIRKTFTDKWLLEALFFRHLTLEKIMKSLYVNKTGLNAPLIHDLVKLADKVGIELNIENVEMLTALNKFNIEGRYPDYRKKLRENINKKHAREVFNKSNEFFKWTLNQLKKQKKK